MSTLSWVWSHAHQDHYYVTWENGAPVYHWYKEIQAAAAEPSRQPQDTLARRDSGTQPSQASQAVSSEMPVPAPNDARDLPGFISGTPQSGWYDLDRSYRMRTGQELYDFFKVGRIFAMLYSEAAGETANPRLDEYAYTEVRYGGMVHTNIRRFVVVDVRQGFVYAYAIGTYGGRGANRNNWTTAQHTIVYFTGTDPASCYLPGEFDNGMTKDPIEVLPAQPSFTLHRASRIRFGKLYPIEMNVKVKDIGRVHPGQLSTLRRYRDEER